MKTSNKGNLVKATYTGTIWRFLVVLAFFKLFDKKIKTIIILSMSH